MRNLGIIQGRLSRPTNGFQDCPRNWIKEFDKLEKLNLCHIDWVVTKKSFDSNPIFKKDLKKYPINSICADNLVDVRFFEYDYLKEQLLPICKSALDNNIESVTIPLLEESSIDDYKKRQIFKENVSRIHDDFKSLIFSFEFESNLDNILDIVNARDEFKVTYDTGNFTSFTKDYNSHIYLLPKLFNKIDNVHLKDRKFNCETVNPGEGDTNFLSIFSMLKKYSYNGKFTIQTARGINGMEQSTILKHINYFKSIF
jgi:hypothetical protein